MLPLGEGGISRAHSWPVVMPHPGSTHLGMQAVYLEGADAEAKAIRRLCVAAAPASEPGSSRELVINGRHSGIIAAEDLMRLHVAVRRLQQEGADIRFVDRDRAKPLPPIVDAGGNSPTVMVIDRDSKLRTQLMGMLSQLGLKVVGVPQPAAAVRLIRHRAPGMVLMEDDGDRLPARRFANLVRAIVGDSPLPIIVLGRDLRPGEEDEFTAGFTKPLPLRILVATVEREIRYVMRVQSGTERKLEDLLSKPPAATPQAAAAAGPIATRAARESQPTEPALPVVKGDDDPDGGG